MLLLSVVSAGHRVHLTPFEKTDGISHETEEHHPVVGGQRINNIDNYDDLQYYGNFMFGAN